MIKIKAYKKMHMRHTHIRHMDIRHMDMPHMNILHIPNNVELSGTRWC